MKNGLSLSKDKIKILLLENIHPQAENIFRLNGYSNIESLPSTLDPELLMDKIRDAYLIGIRSRTRLNSRVLENASRLIAVGCFCIGTDQVDLDKAAGAGIPVFNAPHSSTRSVAELVIGLAIMLFREIFPKSLAAHRSQWRKSASSSFEVRGKTLGIIGYGHIGSQVSILAEALGMRVLYYDIRTKLPLGNTRPVDSLEELLQESDIITLHVPDDETTFHMINRHNIDIMKEGSYLINASRGNVIEIKALAESLRSGHLKGAAVDVFPEEPQSNTEKFNSLLIGLENVILSPHVGGSTVEAQMNIGAEVAHKLVYFSDRGSTEGAVNFPMVNLRPNENAHRLLHIHQNKPGLISAINHKVAEKGINVVGQYLETNHEIGYVVTDIDKTVAKNQLNHLRREIEAIEGTIRTRVLY